MARLRSRGAAGPQWPILQSPTAWLLGSSLVFAALLLHGLDVGMQTAEAGSTEGLPEPITQAATAALDIMETCQPEHAQQLGGLFNELRATEALWTACPGDEYLVKFQEISPAGKKTMIDVGCNKGYTSATFFALWAPELNFTPAAIYEHALALNIDGAGGNCGDGMEKPVPAAGSQPQTDFQVLCVEPQILNFALLATMREKFFQNKPPGLHWHLLHAAVSNGSGFVPFAHCFQGAEHCSLDSANEKQEVIDKDYVPLTRIDDLLNIYGFTDKIDVLKIDTEGYDPAALESAMGALQSGRVGILHFEYHGLGLWAQNTLQDWVQRLDQLDYVCYMAGKKGPNGSLARLTGCWDPAYEIKHWSNVNCVHRKHAMYPEMEKLSTRYAKYKGEYFKQRR